MAVTVTYDAKQGTNRKLGAALARGKRSQAYRINFSGLSYSGSGVTIGFAGMVTLDMVMFEQKSGYQVYYFHDGTQSKIGIVGLASDFALSSWTELRGWVWGD